jgi:hypothetical protein
MAGAIATRAMAPAIQAQRRKYLPVEKNNSDSVPGDYKVIFMSS